MNVFKDNNCKYLRSLKESIAELSTWELEALTDCELVKKIDYIITIAKMRQYTRIMKQSASLGKDILDIHEKEHLKGYAYQLIATYFEHKFDSSDDYKYIIRNEGADSLAVATHLYSFFDALLQSNYARDDLRANMSSCILSLQETYPDDYDTLDAIYDSPGKYGRSKIKGKIIRNI
jgi:hypothetical protein